MLLAWVASASVLIASTAPLAAGHLSADRACAPALLEAHDHAAHRIGGAPAASADHCGVCHLTRTARDVSFAHSHADAGLVPEAASEPPVRAASRVDLHTDYTRGPPQN